MENKKSFGTFICQRRKELGMTQKEFAQRLFHRLRGQQMGAGAGLP